MSEALRMLKEESKVMDIGQITLDERKELNKMVRRGEIKKGKQYWASLRLKTIYYVENN